MIILLPINTEQSFNCIPRVYSEDVTVIIKDETTNIETEIVPSVTITDDTFNVAFSYDFKNNRYYLLKILTDQVVYVDIIFCTDQTEAYSINKDLYKVTNIENKYIRI